MSWFVFTFANDLWLVLRQFLTTHFLRGRRSSVTWNYSSCQKFLNIIINGHFFFLVLVSKSEGLFGKCAKQAYTQHSVHKISVSCRTALTPGMSLLRLLLLALVPMWVSQNSTLSTSSSLTSQQALRVASHTKRRDICNKREKERPHTIQNEKSII